MTKGGQRGEGGKGATDLPHHIGVMAMPKKTDKEDEYQQRVKDVLEAICQTRYIISYELMPMYQFYAEQMITVSSLLVTLIIDPVCTYRMIMATGL